MTVRMHNGSAAQACERWRTQEKQGLPVSTREEEGVAKAFLRYRAALHRYLLRFVPSHETAEDLVQDTFVKAYGAAANRPNAVVATGNERSTRNYLFTTARRLAIDHHRRTQRRDGGREPTITSDDVPDDAPAVDEQVISRQELQILCEAIAQLPTQARRVFTLHRVYGLSHRQIADELGITVSTAQNHMCVANRLVTEYLEALDCRSGKVSARHEMNGSRHPSGSRHD